MKKLLVVMLVLAMASVANAALLLSVNGTVDPPETEVWMTPSEWAVIDVYSDGQTQSDTEVWLTIVGPGEMDVTNGTVYGVVDPEKLFEVDAGLIYIDLVIPGQPEPPIPEGVVVDLMDFHCTGPEDVILLLGSAPGASDFDTQVIHQIPEPMTIVLLGLGGLMLRRRK